MANTSRAENSGNSRRRNVVRNVPAVAKSNFHSGKKACMPRLTEALWSAGLRSSLALSNFENDVASKPSTMIRLRPARTGIPFRLALVALAALAFAARPASVRTLEGKWLEGELRFNDAGALVLKPGEGEPVTMELKDIA